MEDLGFRSHFFLLEKIVLVVEWSGTPPPPTKVVSFIDKLVKNHLWVATT